jgi:hypothetical protein
LSACSNVTSGSVVAVAVPELLFVNRLLLMKYCQVSNRRRLSRKLNVNV